MPLLPSGEVRERQELHYKLDSRFVADYLGAFSDGSAISLGRLVDGIDGVDGAFLGRFIPANIFVVSSFVTVPRLAAALLASRIARYTS